MLPELDDSDWTHVLTIGSDWTGTDDVAGVTVGPGGFAALLAELDRIAGELCSWDPWALRRLQTWSTSNAPRAIAMGLLDAAVGTGCATIHELTPLGRAVLRRSQETR